MSSIKIEKSGVSFAVASKGGPIGVEVRLNHDTIASLRGVKVNLELLNGISLAQAKKLVDVLNENVIGVLATTASDDQTKAAVAGEVATQV
jgi:hypothetical protein